MKIVCREAKESDLEGILRLHRQLELDESDFLTVQQARPIFSRMSGYPDYRLYVATQDTDVVGTFALLIMDNLAHLGAPSGIIEDVVVDEGLRARGIGEQMMRYAMDLCRQKGCYKVMLSSNIRRELAHRFYENLGFERHGYSFSIDLEKRENKG